ncbi:MAG: AAA family ATPase [Paludibacteraceae bacterium]|nr:AAA family ATPase [Paludibacteraceae bacterium]
METNEKTYDYENPLAERESVPVDEFLIEDQWQDVDLEGNWLDPKEEYKRPKFTLSYKGVPFAPLGGIHGLTGQPGHGKTFTFTQLMVAILKGEYYGLRYELRDEIPQPKVLYIDTEMEKSNTMLVLLRVYEMMGWEPGSQHDEFRILWLREEVKSVDRWRKTLKAISTIQPTVVFLDGLIDVVSDFNDNVVCQEIIYKCMSAASHYKMSMWLLLHENPGSEKMVGHAGSFLERKATDVLKTKKEKGAEVIFRVSQKKARARDLEEWPFRIEDDEHHYGHPVIIDAEEIVAADPDSDFDMSEENIERAVREAIGNKTLKEFTIREHLKRNNHIGSSKALECITRATSMGVLLNVGDIYRAVGPMFNDDENEQEGDPF